jgi:hypothetical protein
VLLSRTVCRVSRFSPAARNSKLKKIPIVDLVLNPNYKGQ